MRSTSRIVVSFWLAILPLVVLTAAPQAPAPQAPAPQASAPQAPARAARSVTALDRYVAAPDSSFAWKVLRELPAEGATATLIEMTSQRWLTEREVERPLWTHWITVVRPARVTSDIAFLYITGGSLDWQPPAKPPAWLVEAARDTGTVTAELRLVPNQPLVFTDDGGRGRSEDEHHRLHVGQVPAHRRRALAGPPADDQGGGAGDGRGHRLLALAAGGGHAARSRSSSSSGASKRGWTTWTTAAVDARVVGHRPGGHRSAELEPSFDPPLPRLRRSTRRGEGLRGPGLMDWLGTPQFRALMRIEDPYKYRDRLTMPKFMVNATGDQFFLPDSSQFYFDDLPGEKYLRYVPNADALARQDRRARERAGVLRLGRERHEAARDQVDVRARWRNQGHLH